jgi:hypothetical protein
MPLTQVSPGLLDSNAQYYGFKNRIINGAMGISQRGTSFSTPAAAAYNLDRWLITWTGAAPATIAQVAGPTGFRNAVQITGAASNTQFGIGQRIESLNCSDLSGQTVTIQANIATSASQTIYWQLAHPNTQDNYAAATVIAQGTWSTTSTATTFTATATGLPSGATNGLQFFIYANNAGAFTSGTLTITGVQLEKGSTATSFDFRPYGTELALCQRYFESFNASSNPGGIYALGWATSGTNTRHCLPYIVEKRSGPTLTFSAASTFNMQLITNTAVSSFITYTAGPKAAWIGVNYASTVIAAGQACALIDSQTSPGTSFIQLNSEL